MHTFTGTGRSLTAAIESALSSAHAPFRFTVISLGGECDAEKNLAYRVEVQVWSDAIEEVAGERRGGTGELGYCPVCHGPASESCTESPLDHPCLPGEHPAHAGVR